MNGNGSKLDMQEGTNFLLIHSELRGNEKFSISNTKNKKSYNANSVHLHVVNSFKLLHIKWMPVIRDICHLAVLTGSQMV